MFMHSSQGNEAATQARQTEIGSDVIANFVIAYWKFTPIEGGFQIQQAQCMDPAGMILGSIRTNKFAFRARPPCPRTGRTQGLGW